MKFLLNRDYFAALVRLSLPIVLQSLVFNFMNAMDVFLVGQLGEVAVAGVGLAGQIFFLLNLLLFGVCSGAAIFTAQYWGKQDIAGIRRATGLCLVMSLISGLIFSIVAIFTPTWALSIYTTDPAVIKVGSDYLRVIGLSFLASSVTSCYANILRSTGNVRPQTLISSIAIVFKTGLAYLLIFGNPALSLPALGAVGAAIGTAIARVLEAIALVWYAYASRQPAAGKLKELFTFSREFFLRFMSTTLPVALNESLWAFGITIYNIVFAHIGTAAVAATSIAYTIEGLTFAFYIGLANGNSILIGNRIGAGDEKGADEDARRALTLGVILALVVGSLVFATRGIILPLYKVSAEAQALSQDVLAVLSCFAVARALNMILIVAVLRSGGDTRFSLFMDTGVTWLVGVPMALLGGIVFKLAVPWVVLMIMTEELTKTVLGVRRYRSKRWIHNLTELV